jgi:hypothetical protein
MAAFFCFPQLGLKKSALIAWLIAVLKLSVLVLKLNHIAENCAKS